MATAFPVEKAERVVQHLTEKAFDFYFDTFVRRDSPTLNPRTTAAVKSSIIAEFVPRSSQESIMREAVTLKYSGGDGDVFVHKAEKFYLEAKFNESAMRGLLRDAISNSSSLFQFVLLRNAVNITEIKEACTSYAEDQKLLYKTDEPTPSSVPFGDGPRVEIEKKVDKLCDHMSELALAMSQKKYPPARPKTCNSGKEEGYIATSCERNQMKGIKCGFCKRWGHNEVACYSKQRKDLDDELARLVRLLPQSQYRTSDAQEAQGAHGLLPRYCEDEVRRRRGEDKPCARERRSGSTDDEDFTSATETESSSESGHGEIDLVLTIRNPVASYKKDTSVPLVRKKVAHLNPEVQHQLISSSERTTLSQSRSTIRALQACRQRILFHCLPNIRYTTEPVVFRSSTTKSPGRRSTERLMPE